MNKKVKIAMLIHIYYVDMYEIMKHLLCEIKHPDVLLIFKINADAYGKIDMSSRIAEDFKDALVIQSPNVGKDIGGKLTLISLCLQLQINPEFYVLLHDKKSPHTTFGDIWRNKLFRIIEKDNFSRIQHMFLHDDKIGIVAAKEFIINEYDASSGDFKTTNNKILRELISEHQLNLKSYEYIGGTMFWVRAHLINTFFSEYDPMEIVATLEKGNVLDHDFGTRTHSWERMLSWIVTHQGYKIKGI